MKPQLWACLQKEIEATSASDRQLQKLQEKQLAVLAQLLANRTDRLSRAEATNEHGRQSTNDERENLELQQRDYLHRKAQQLQELIIVVQTMQESLSCMTFDAEPSAVAPLASIVEDPQEEVLHLRQTAEKQAAELAELKAGKSAEIEALNESHRREMEALRLQQMEERKQAEAKLEQLGQNFILAKQR